MDLTKMTETELKALWLDQLLQMEIRQNNIKAIQEEIKRRPTEPTK